ncbi:MAG: hypothetical protein LWX56_05260 [Ignavibacteria bacterium]|nr:hypothetical protein [Ignavibacteria bacterium]
MRSRFHKIVNYFLGFFISLFALIIIIIGFTQTSTFREFARNKVLTILNDSLNGHINIEKIDGTIFTTLIVRNATLFSQGDTIASVGRVALHLKPLEIFRKTIAAESVEITDLNARLYSDSAGSFNISKVFPSSPKDSTHSEFPFKIQVSSLKISNVNADICSEVNRHHTDYVDNFSLNNFRVRKFQFEASASVDIARKEFLIQLKKTGFESNITDFGLQNFSGIIFASRDSVVLKDLNLITQRSKLNLSLSARHLNIFGDSLSKALHTAPLSLNLKAEPFHFGDLHLFVPATTMLAGPLELQCNAHGSFDKLAVDMLNIQCGESELQVSGQLEKIFAGSHMQIKAAMQKSKILQSDISNLLPGIKLPDLKNFSTVGIDSLRYSGTPLVFDIDGKLLAGSGVLSFDSQLDFAGTSAKYQLSTRFSDVDISSFSKVPVILNGTGNIAGTSFTPSAMVAEFTFNAGYSVIGNNVFRKLDFFGEANAGEIDAHLITQTDHDSVEANIFAVVNDSIPSYNANLNICHLNLASLMRDTSLNTDINLSARVEGRGVNLHDILGSLNLDMRETTVFGNTVDGLRADVLFTENSSKQRKLKIVSDVFDAELNGSYYLDNLINVTVDELNRVQGIITRKLQTYFPDWHLELDSLQKIKMGSTPVQNGPAENLFATFSVTPKNIDKINAFLKKREISFDGSLYGSIKTTSDSCSMQLNCNVNFASFADSLHSFFIENGNLEFDLGNKIFEEDLNNIRSNLLFSADQAFMGNRYKNIDCQLRLQNGALIAAAKLGLNENFSADLKLHADLYNDSIAATVQKLSCKYNTYELANRTPGTVVFAHDNFYINDLSLWRGDSKFALKGIFSRNGNNDLQFTASGVKGYDISYSLLNLASVDVIDNDLGCTAHMTGTLEKPNIDFRMQIDNITYKKLGLGSFAGTLAYSDDKLNFSAHSTNTINGKTATTLSIDGYLPIYLGIGEVAERLHKDLPLLMDIRANNFDMHMFSDFVPNIVDVKGFVESDIHIGGTYNNPMRNGYLRLNNGSFRAVLNNLEYSAGAVLKLTDKEIALDSIIVQNISKVKTRGTMRGAGRIDISDLDNIKVEIRANGSLSVFGPDSKTPGAALYGDMFLESGGDIVFTMADGQSFLRMPLVVTDAALIFPPMQNVYSGARDNFYYRYPEEKIKLSAREEEIRKLLSQAAERKQLDDSKGSTGLNFDYEISMSMKNEGNFTFIFAQESNQKLTALLKGDVLFERKYGIQNFQGELKVLEGSTLEFIKSFTATGSLRFESDITNPYLDIVGLYKGYYTEVDTSKGPGSQKEEEVAVKVKLSGPLQDMAKNFSKSDDNIAIYYGKTNIEKNIASTEYDKADAMWFVLLGKFKKDISSQDKTKTAGQIDPITGTATSVAGSVIGGLLNNYLGEVVRTIELRNMGTSTKFNLSGRYKNFRYTIGGSTNFLQDFSTANLRVEYPIFEKFFIRVERKEATSEINSTNDMINEVGFRYSFEF